MSELRKIISNTVEKVNYSNFSSITTIPKYMFAYRTNLKRLLCGNVTSIGSYAFYDCTELQYVDATNVTTIDTDAFYNCTNMNYFYIPDATLQGTHSISWSAFQNSGIENSNYGTILNDYLFVGTPPYDIRPKSIVIPSNCIRMNRYAAGGSWGSSYKLTSFEIPSTVTIFDSYSLYGVRDCPKIIMRQGANVALTLPTAGENTGLAYNKSTTTCSIYTDNLAIRNYDWSTDNVTVTFYPLSEA